VSDSQLPSAPEPTMLDHDPWLGLVLGAALLTGVGFRLYGLEIFDLMGEETDTFIIARDDPGRYGLFSGYYWLIRLLMNQFGETPLVTRLPALVLGVATLGVFYWAVRAVLGESVAVFASALLAFSHWHVEQSQAATFYAALFLFGTLFFSSVLIVLQWGERRFLWVAVASGGLAVLCQYAAALMFLPVAIYALLALALGGLTPGPDARRLLLRLVLILVVMALAPLPAVLGDLAAWLQQPAWGTMAWSLIPLLAVNLLSVPVFVGALVGLVCLFQHRQQVPALLLLSLSIVTVLLTLGIMGAVMNVAHQYLFGLMPLFYIAAGAFCATLYERFRGDNPLIGLAPCALLVIATLPQLLSYYLERENISEAVVLRDIVERAEPGDRLFGNVWSPLVDLSTLEVLDDPVPPYDGSFDWNGYLNEHFAAGGDPVWFAFQVPRSGITPDLKRWLVAHTELVEERVSGRIDRRERVLSVWYLD